jgi:formylglycine-generating enzyme required for sulfatase activity
MGRTEVTWDEFRHYFLQEPLRRNPRGEEVPRPREEAEAVTRPTPPYIEETRGFGEKGYPVVGISHHAAMQYCRWLSLKTGKVYRLPTEAEWEFAARAGTRTAWHFGDDPRPLADHAWFGDNAEEKTHPVGTRKPNPWGLYDLYGNVAEWCLDHYRKDFYATLALGGPALSPVLLPGPNRYPHVVRGGSWADDAPRCRSAARRGSDKSWNRQDPQRPPSIWWLADADFVGFRVVRAVEEQKELRGLRSQVTPESP